MRYRTVKLTFVWRCDGVKIITDCVGNDLPSLATYESTLKPKNSKCWRKIAATIPSETGLRPAFSARQRVSALPVRRYVVATQPRNGFQGSLRCCGWSVRLESGVSDASLELAVEQLELARSRLREL